MADVVGIWNRALQKLGAGRVASVSDQSPAARACATCYDALRQALLRSHSWNFSIKRFQLAADATAPAFGFNNSFSLPTGSLKPLPPDASQNTMDRDWIVESGALLTNDSAPLNLRCVLDVTDPNLMDPLFREALSSLMAQEMCEALTQSNTKFQNAQAGFKMAIAEARKANAIEKVPQEAPLDDWVTTRFNGSRTWGR